MAKITEAEKLFTDEAWKVAQSKSLNELDIKSSALNIIAYFMKKNADLTKSGYLLDKNSESLILKRMRALVFLVLDELENNKQEKENANQTQNQNSPK